MDGTTSGPINSWFVLLVRAVGLPFTYRCMHAVSALLLGAIVATNYLTVRLFLPMRQAVWVGLVGTLAVGTSSAVDFMHFSTEQLPATMLAVATFGCVWVLKKNTRALPLLLVAGFLAGLVPWAKLQGVPVAGIVGAFALWLAVRSCSAPGCSPRFSFSFRFGEVAPGPRFGTLMFSTDSVTPARSDGKKSNRGACGSSWRANLAG